MNFPILVFKKYVPQDAWSKLVENALAKAFFEQEKLFVHFVKFLCGAGRLTKGKYAMSMNGISWRTWDAKARTSEWQYEMKFGSFTFGR
jgi:hypothetical protein